jgi:hypothetical protein
MSKPQLKVNFREPNKTLLGRIFSFFGVELNRKYQLGYFHLIGYSGNQKDGKPDIVIIEKTDGSVVTIPNNEKYYNFVAVNPTSTITKN